MKKSKVYFIPVSEADRVAQVVNKLRTLIERSAILDFISKGCRVALKTHFGEEGNTGFVKPEYVRLVCDAASLKGAKPFLAETNTLYKGRRTNSRDHLAIAAEHGFTKETIGADIVIPDDSKKENTIDVAINQKLIKTAKLVRFFVAAEAIIGINHFKGHIVTGCAGALKNLGMGCASRQGKLMQHSDISPVVYEQKCTGCAECEKACPVQAIRIKNNKSVIDGLKCIGCATCIAVCPFAAIDVNWESGGSTMPEKMVEYALAVMKGKEGKLAFINFALKITKECDCLAKDDPRVSPDIGIFASCDPVSIDKASLDMVNKACGRDIFRELHPHRDSARQLSYACALGLGNLDYELITLSCA
ncbi:MAG: DUF362 domain-containing protein [Candidatus Omnitrophica bacterium]|nr:DUF362 domain-containing protein [Candidatus Omnitrophota bacterium]